MSSILYYSRYCTNCAELLKYLSKSPAKEDIHFVCVDERETRPNGAVYVKLSGGEELLLPPTITKVPGLLLLNRGHQVLFGEAIKTHLAPAEEASTAAATQGQGEPTAFAFGSGAGFGVASDSFSFIDQDADQMAAKGSGGLRQAHHYARIGAVDAIQTPPDTYDAGKVTPKEVERLQEARSADAV